MLIPSLTILTGNMLTLCSDAGASKIQDSTAEFGAILKTCIISLYPEAVPFIHKDGPRQATQGHLERFKVH